MSESYTDYSRDSLRRQFTTLDSFLHAWKSADQKSALLEELAREGIFLDKLREEAGPAAVGVDDFDLLLHVAFDRPPLTKKERIEHVIKSDYLNRYSEDCRLVLSALLDKYGDIGISELENLGVLRNMPFVQFGTPRSIAEKFGGREQYLAAVRDLEKQLYAVV